MRIEVKMDGAALEASREEHVIERVRWALGGYASEVRSAHVTLEQRERGVVCAIRLRLRGRRTVAVSSEGASFEEALSFVATRAGAAVARRVDTDRMMGG